MAIKLSEPARNGRLAAIRAIVDGGSGPGYIEVRSGARPANVGVAATGTVLVTFTLADPSFADPAAGVMTLDADPDIAASAAAGGNASWARCYASDGTAAFDGDVGTSGTDFIISAVAIASGQPVNLVAGQLTDPA